LVFSMCVSHARIALSWRTAVGSQVPAAVGCDETAPAG
jgi:hypothetical protein